MSSNFLLSRSAPLQEVLQSSSFLLFHGLLTLSVLCLLLWYLNTFSKLGVDQGVRLTSPRELDLEMAVGWMGEWAWRSWEMILLPLAVPLSIQVLNVELYLGFWQWAPPLNSQLPWEPAAQTTWLCGLDPTHRWYVWHQRSRLMLPAVQLGVPHYFYLHLYPLKN